MILASGLYGHTGRTANPHKPTLPTAAQTRSVTAWATVNLADVPTAKLQKALGVVSAHPDAQSPGYSRARSTRQRLEAALATRS